MKEVVEVVVTLAEEWCHLEAVFLHAAAYHEDIPSVWDPGYLRRKRQETIQPTHHYMYTPAIKITGK